MGVFLLSDLQYNPKLLWLFNSREYGNLASFRVTFVEITLIVVIS